MKQKPKKKSAPMKIACIGEVMIELIARENGQAAHGVAGDTYNTAAYLSMLSSGSEVETSYVTALGVDRFSERIFSQIQNLGIRTNLIERREHLLPGLYAIDTDEGGERTFSYWRGQSAARTLFQAPGKITPDKLLDFDLIYLSGISMAILPAPTRSRLIDFLASYRKSGGRLAYDSNYRARLWESTEEAQVVNTKMWSLTDIALPSLDDEILLFEDKDENAVLQRLTAAGVTYGALKRGVEGPRAIGEKVTAAFEKITQATDTTAAGDSFNAGFLYQNMMGSSLEDAMQAGHELASKVIQTRGAIVAIDQ